VDPLVELPLPPKLSGERIELDPSQGLVRAALDVALEDPAYRLYSNLPPDIDSDVLSDHREEKGDRGEAAYWAILPESRQIAGIFELWFRDPKAGILEAGYWVLEAERRRGYATEALRLVTDWVRQGTTATKIELAIHPDNEYSKQLAQRAGYRYAGQTTPSSPGVPRDEFYELYLWERGDSPKQQSDPLDEPSR
jgi:RimJ/RimL family protein N-acetyltransferase